MNAPTPLPTPYDITEWPALPLEVPPISWVVLGICAVLIAVCALAIIRRSRRRPSGLVAAALVRRELDRLLERFDCGAPQQQLAFAARLVRDFLDVTAAEGITSWSEGELRRAAKTHAPSPLSTLLVLLADAEERTYAPACDRELACALIQRLRRQIESVQ